MKSRISALLCRKTCHSKARAQYSDLQAAVCEVNLLPHSYLAAQQPKQLWPLSFLQRPVFLTGRASGSHSFLPWLSSMTLSRLRPC